MTFPRYLAISKYWTKHPPTHILVAAYLQYKPPSSASSSSTGSGPNTVNLDIETMMRLGPQGVVNLSNFGG